MCEQECIKRYTLLQEANRLYQDGDVRGLEQMLQSLKEPSSEEEEELKNCFWKSQIYDLAHQISTLEQSIWKLSLKPH